jgi:mono/diheme cytochrome c family protein
MEMIKNAMLGSLLFCITGCFAQKKTAIKESIDRGQQVYSINCISCHMEKGEGVEGTFPPLVQSGYVTGDTKRLINIILQGQSGEIVVNGKTYNMDMPAQSHLSDEEVADVLNFIRTSWGNKSKKVITAADVKPERKE